MLIDTKELKASITRLRRVATKRPSLPGLAWVKFEAFNNGRSVTLEATDLELSMTIALVAKSKKGETFTCNLVDLADAVKAAPWSKQIDIHKDSGKQLVSIGGMLVVAQDESNFPTLPEHLDGDANNIADLEPLRAAVEQVLPAASVDEARYNLNAILLTKLGTGVRLAATDGHRMAMRHVPDLNLGDLGKKGVLVPTGFWKAALPLLKTPGFQHERHMNFTVEGKLATLNLPGVRLTTRLIEGEAPAMEQVVPTKTQGLLSIPREPWLAEIARVAKVLKRKGSRHCGAMVIQVEGEWARIYGTPDGEDDKRELGALPVGHITPTWTADLGFNPVYFRDALQGLSGEMVMVKLVDPGKDAGCLMAPAIFGDAVTPGFAIVMPVRTE